MPLGNSLAFIKLHKNSFSGAFQNSNPNFHFYCPPHQHISIFKNQAPSKVKCHRTAFCRDQTVTERPVRPRVSAPAIVEILANVFMCHTPVTLIKSTYYYYRGGVGQNDYSITWGVYSNDYNVTLGGLRNMCTTPILCNSCNK